MKKLMDMFPDDDSARKWLESEIWPDGPVCPHCDSTNIQYPIRHRTMTHRCRDCANRPQFSLKSGTVMKGTKLDYRDWVIAIYLLTTNLRGVSSTKLRRDLEITQKSAWHLLHRLRKSFETRGGLTFSGPVEADETFVGGLERNWPRRKKLKAGRGGVGKAIIVGATDRQSNCVVAGVIPDTTARTLQGFAESHTEPKAQVYTDPVADRGLSSGARGDCHA
ncbi:MAG: IS1595 family transposase [Hyphomonadaceae bacterium]|nr:IS1595 family transposase [Hyphomonadaceae bacterium]